MYDIFPIYDILEILLNERNRGICQKEIIRNSSYIDSLKIMQEQTDDEHYITMPEIMKGLAQYDVTADRKSIYADLRDLSVLGVDVEGEPVGNRYHYHVVNRAFELPELKLLVDAIQSSKFITEKKSNALIKKSGNSGK